MNLLKNKSLKLRSSLEIPKIQTLNHPWLLSTSPPRRMQNSALGMLKEKFFKAVGVDKAQKLIPGYDFPRQFLDEAAVVADEIFHILSDKEKQTSKQELSQVMTALLADAFAKGNQELRASDQIPQWKIDGKPKLSLRGVHLTFGPYPPPQGYVFQHWWSIMSLIVPKEDAEFISHQQQKRILKEAQEQGIFMRINVRLMNHIEFVCLKQGQEVFKDRRHYVDLEFMSPHFNPWDELHYLDSDGEWNLNWKWRLSDVDFLLQSQMM